MCLYKRFGNEVISARMSHRRPKLHLLGHAAVDCLRLNGAARIELLPIPFRNSSRRKLNATTQTALVRALLLLKRIVRVSFHLLHCFSVDGTFGLIDYLFPTRF